MFHGALDVTEFPNGFWVRLRWAPEPSLAARPLVLRLRHVRGAKLVLFPAPGTRCATPPTRSQALDGLAMVPADTAIASISGWRTLPLCAADRVAFLHVQQLPAKRIDFQVVSPADAKTLDFLEAAAVYVAGGLGLMACLLALGRLLIRRRDALAVALLVEQISRTPFWVQTLEPPPFTNLAALNRLTTHLNPETLRTGLVAGLLVFMQLMLHNQKHHSAWHRAVSALTGLGVLLFLSSFFLPGANYATWLWALFLTALPISIVVALGAIPTRDSHPRRFGGRPLHEANWGLAAIVTLAWLTTAAPLLEVTPDVALVTALPFYLVVAISVLMEAAGDSKRALTEALTQRMAREQSEREAALQSQQHAETRDLLLMLTHELRTPLGVLRFSLDAIPSMPSARTRAEDAIRSMNALVERCLQAAHLETDATAEKAERWNPARELPLLVQQTRNPERVQTRVDDNTPAPVTRQAVLGMIISVLLDNALKYGNSQLPVEVYAQMEVRDGRTGLGLTVDNRPGPTGLPDPKRLFRKYYRSAGAHQHTGAGLGLYLAAKLTQRLGGELGYQALPNTTRFKLWIPD